MKKSKKQATATSRNIRITPRKARLVLDLIRNKDVSEMKDQLSVNPKKSAKLILKVLNSAIANAKQKELKIDDLTIDNATAGEGISMKRRWLKSRGRATVYKKTLSHVTITVSEKNIKGQEK